MMHFQVFAGKMFCGTLDVIPNPFGDFHIFTDREGRHRPWWHIKQYKRLHLTRIKRK